MDAFELAYWFTAALVFLVYAAACELTSEWLAARRQRRYKRR